MSFPIVAHGWSWGHSHTYSYAEDNQKPSIRMARRRKALHTLTLWICYKVLQNQNHQSLPVLRKAWCSHHRLGWKTGERSAALVMRLGIKLEIPVIYLPHHWALIFIFFMSYYVKFLRNDGQSWASTQGSLTPPSISSQYSTSEQVRLEDFCQYDSFSAKSF